MNISEKIKTIDDQLAYLRRERNKLAMEYIGAFQDSHREAVGKCFKMPSGRRCIIIDVPRPDYDYDLDTVMDSIHEFPAFFLNPEESDELVPFWDDTAFTADSEHFGPRGMAWEEITIDEFKAEFNKRITQLWNSVFQNIGKPEDRQENEPNSHS